MAVKIATLNFLSVIFLGLITGGFSEVYFNFENHCTSSVWLAASPGIGDQAPEIGPDTLEVFIMPDPWTGTIWARTKCSTNDTGYFSCETGDCGVGEMDCQGPQPKYPVTSLNFNIDHGSVSYELSLNHGHNIPARIQPEKGTLVGGSGPCPVVDCVGDIGNVCPPSLVATNTNGAYVGCNSACDGLKDPKYCCTGNVTGPDCKPNEYSEAFKKLCGLAHTYPEDKNPPIYKCSEAERYTVTFCAPK